MHNHAEFAYAQARLQAHNGRRPTRSTWQYLNASKSLGHYLESARQTGLGPWVGRITANSNIHVIEEALHNDWRTYVQKVSVWLPPSWRPATEWTAVLADLPQAASSPQIDQDPTLGHARDEASADAHSWANGALEQWAKQFRKLWPPCRDRERQQLENLLILLGHELGPHQRAHSLDGTKRRHQLSLRLERLLHHHGQTPLAAFAFLSLVAVDLQHLRAHLVHRSLFPETLDNR